MNQIATLPKQNITGRFATRFGVEPEKVFDILKATAFKTKDGPPSDAQMQALLIVADQYGLNPFTKEIYAFPDKQNGIVPVVGVDGWSRIINTHDQFDGMEFVQSDTVVKIDADAKECPEWIECRVFRKDRSHHIAVREYLDETYRKAFKKDGPGGYTVNGPWQSHTKRMLRHKSMIQCARVAFGFVGIYDEDEAERIVDAGYATIEKTPEQLKLEQQERFKEAHDEAFGRHSESMEFIRARIAADDMKAAVAEWALIPEADQRALWIAPSKGGYMTTIERTKLKDAQGATAADAVNRVNEDIDKSADRAAKEILG